MSKRNGKLLLTILIFQDLSEVPFKDERYGILVVDCLPHQGAVQDGEGLVVVVVSHVSGSLHRP